MILHHRDGRTIDVQPRQVSHWEAKGWSRTPPKPPRKKRESKPDSTSGDVSEESTSDD